MFCFIFFLVNFCNLVPRAFPVFVAAISVVYRGSGTTVPNVVHRDKRTKPGNENESVSKFATELAHACEFFSTKKEREKRFT